jgi:hypothetical protein
LNETFASAIARARRLRRTARHLATIVTSPDQRKHALRWLRSLREGFLFDEPSPWITFDAIDYIQAFLQRMTDRAEAPRVFEYGSGGSTRFWLSRGAQCVSIEHDPDWFKVVRGRLGAAKIDYRLIEPQPTIETTGGRGPADPEAYASDDERYRGLSFRKYASAIDEFAAGHFHIVLVDGRARPSCLAHAADKVRAGGLLVLDNAEREYYTSIAGARLARFQRLPFWGALPTSHQFTRTDVYLKAD